MFVLLPVFLAFGFVVGYGVKRHSERVMALLDAALKSVLNYGVALAVAAGLMIVALAWYFSRAQFHTSGRATIALGAFAVGFVAGLWFVNAKDEKESSGDVFKFIFGAGLLVVLAAVQYDTRAFDRLFARVDKFSAAGVSLELKDDVRALEAARPRDNSPDAGTIDADNLRGGGELDFVVETLGKLGEYALRDEEYARLFSKDRPEEFPFDDAVALMRTKPMEGEMAQAYIRFNCDRVATLAGEMGLVQSVLREERVADPRVEELLADLKTFYFLQLNQQKPKADQIQNDLDSLRDRLEQESHSIAPSAPSNLRKGACEKFPKEDRWERIPQKDLSRDKDFEPLGYLALAVSLLESAVGDREGAVQLLEREIDRQRQQFLAGETGPDMPTGCAANASTGKCAKSSAAESRRLEGFRRLMLIVRLEDVQDGLMEGWAVPALAKVRLHALQRRLEDINRAYALLLPTETQTPSLYAVKDGDTKAARCQTETRKNPGRMRLIDQYSLSRAVAISNALETASADIDSLTDDGHLRGVLDNYAEYLFAFDIDCIDYLKKKSEIVENISQHFKQIAAIYFEARGGASFDDEEQVKKLQLLCKSRKAFESLSEKIEHAKKPEPDKDNIATFCPAYRELKDDTANPAKPDITLCRKTMQSGIDRAHGAAREAHKKRAATAGVERIRQKMADAFPAGDIDKYCPE